MTTYSNATMLSKLAQELGYKNRNVVTALLPRLGLKPPHTDEEKIRAAIRKYQAKRPKRGGKAYTGQGVRNVLVDKLGLELFPNITGPYGRSKIRAALCRGGYDPPWDDESRMRTVLREQGIRERTTLPVPAARNGNGHGELIERTEAPTEINIAREFAALASRAKIAKFELEQVHRNIVKEVQSGARTDLADGTTPGLLAALAALRGF